MSSDGKDSVLLTSGFAVCKQARHERLETDFLAQCLGEIVFLWMRGDVALFLQQREVYVVFSEASSGCARARLVTCALLYVLMAS